MKKRSVIVLASFLILIVLGILVSTQYGIRREQEIVVATPIIEVSPIFTDLKNWPHWFTGADRYQFHVLSGNLAGVTVRAERANIESIYFISAYPDSIAANTRIKWTTLISGWDWLKQKVCFIKDNPELRLGELKKYFEDPKEFYGFDIIEKHVEDTLVLTKEVMVKKSELPVVLGGLYKELEGDAGKEHGYRIATFYDETKDSIHVAAGIPVSRRVSPVPDGVLLLEMPPRGKQIVGRYQGPYKDLSRLYGAMRKYIADKKLVSIAAPYEKYLSTANSSRDSLNMTIELHIPVL
jgi:effector-binding domain-containing protein